MNSRQRLALIVGLVIAVLILFVPRVWRTGPRSMPVLHHTATKQGAGGVYVVPSVDMEVEIKPLGRLWLAAVVVLLTGAFVYRLRTPAP